MEFIRPDCMSSSVGSICIGSKYLRIPDLGSFPLEFVRKMGSRHRSCSEAEHLSVYQTSPELWEREAFEEKLDGAPEAPGEPGKSSAGELGRLAVRAFFSAGAGLLAWSHIPVETAQ